MVTTKTKCTIKTLNHAVNCSLDKDNKATIKFVTGSGCYKILISDDDLKGLVTFLINNKFPELKQTAQTDSKTLSYL